MRNSSEHRLRFRRGRQGKGLLAQSQRPVGLVGSRRALARLAQAASGQEGLHCATGTLAQRFRLSAELLRRGVGGRLRFFAARGADPAGGAPVGSGRGGRCAARRRRVLQPLEAGILSGSLRGQGDLHPPESAFSTYAFVTAEGEWHEQGRMGWFGMDDATNESICQYEEKFQSYLQEAREKGLAITIVDCHI